MSGFPRLILPIFIGLSFVGQAESQVVHRGDCKVDAEILMLLPECALETRDGHLYVFKEFLPLFFSSGKARLASAVLPEGGWAYFNRRGTIVVQNVANFDNGPSPFHHGLVRVSSKGKWGLADSNGLFVVPLTYDGMFEYDESKMGWTACTGCRKVSDGEHSWFEDGDWYWLDRHGKVAGKAENPMTPKRPGNK
jgi:WG containing repeat